MHLYQSLLLAILIATYAGGASAEKFNCSSQRGLSPYSANPSAVHDHDRFSPRVSGVSKEFEAYVSVFDDADDDDGDEIADFLANPVFVSYELKGVQPQSSGEFVEPDISISRPRDWYKSPELAFLWSERSGVSKKDLITVLMVLVLSGTVDT